MSDTPAPPSAHPGFGEPLGRLLRHRGLGAGALAARAGCEEADVRAALSGETPREEALRRLAPALGYHAVDVFVLAGVPVPEDLAPLDAQAHRWVTSLAYDVVMRLSSAERRELLLAARSLPQKDRGGPFAPKWLQQPTGDPGNWIVRMLRYRNLGPMGLAQTMALLTPTCLSASTYQLIGSNRAELTPRRVTDFAHVLGIDPPELAALADVVLDEVPPPPSPKVLDTRELYWEARRLTSAQVQLLAEMARDMAKEHRGAAQAAD
ncbi:hypothetical protein [Streptomyces sp. NPDC020917]|uniref:hypothetical protein n=1 Tax=Streptomyces sp. NPDC020917 TaxID=3365102 RepID=UPI0037920E77